MICLYGGTFDPVHYGHLRTALEVQQALAIEQVHLLPCHIPPHRDQPLAEPEHRLNMLKLAIADQPALAIDDRELRRHTPSYMVETLHALRDEVSQQPVCLVLGMDAFLGLESWYEWQSLLALTHLVVMQRPGHAWPQSGQLAELVTRCRVKDPRQLFAQAAGLITTVQVSQLAISSSHIRALLAAGHDARYLLPDAVLNYILQHNWYESKHDAS